jgi:hypothetical protein
MSSETGPLMCFEELATGISCGALLETAWSSCVQRMAPSGSSHGTLRMVSSQAWTGIGWLWQGYCGSHTTLVGLSTTLVLK